MSFFSLVLVPGPWLFWSLLLAVYLPSGKQMDMSAQHWKTTPVWQFKPSPAKIQGDNAFGTNLQRAQTDLLQSQLELWNGSALVWTEHPGKKRVLWWVAPLLRWLVHSYIKVSLVPATSFVSSLQLWLQWEYIFQRYPTRIGKYPTHTSYSSYK